MSIFLDSVLPSFPTPGGPMRVDLTQVAGQFELRAELPGAEVHDIELRVAPDCVYISATNLSVNDGLALRRECLQTPTRRVVELPRGVTVNVKEVTASFERGVLVVLLPFTEDALQDHSERVNII